MTQISFGSTIIFPNSVVIKISPFWGTRETKRWKMVKGLSHQCSSGKWQQKTSTAHFPHQSGSLHQSYWSTWNRKTIEAEELLPVGDNVTIHLLVTRVDRQRPTHLSTMEVLHVYMWMPMPLRDLESPAPQTVCRPWKMKGEDVVDPQPYTGSCPADRCWNLLLQSPLSSLPL